MEFLIVVSYPLLCVGISYAHFRNFRQETGKKRLVVTSD